MPLFQQSVVNKYRNVVNKTELQIGWQAFTAHFHNPAMQENIRNLKEEEYQEGFCTRLVCKRVRIYLKPATSFQPWYWRKISNRCYQKGGAILLNNIEDCRYRIKRYGHG